MRKRFSIALAICRCLSLLPTADAAGGGEGKPSADTMAVIVREDGTEEVIRRSAIGEEGLTVAAKGEATVKIVDNAESFVDIAPGFWAGSPEMDTVLTAPDAGKVADYAQRAMVWAMENGIMGGYADGTLNPQGTDSRAHVADMVQRYVNKIWPLSKDCRIVSDAAIFYHFEVLACPHAEKSGNSLHSIPGRRI